LAIRGYVNVNVVKKLFSALVILSERIPDDQAEVADARKIDREANLLPITGYTPLGST
jgi:hypothetical protein